MAEEQIIQDALQKEQVGPRWKARNQRVPYCQPGPCPLSKTKCVSVCRYMTYTDLLPSKLLYFLRISQHLPRMPYAVAYP